MNICKNLFAMAACAAISAFGATDIQTALDNTSLTFTTGGDAEWFSQSSEVHTGSTALQSGTITDNQETWVETTVSGAGMVSFWWKVSSESVNWDWLEVSVDGVVQTKIGGTAESGWLACEAIAVTEGSHVIRWRYRKDGSGIGGSDCGWIDGVAWRPLTEGSISSLSVVGIAFGCEEDSRWNALKADGLSPILSCALPYYYDDYQVDRLTLTVSGPGTLTYKWSTDATSDRYLYRSYRHVEGWSTSESSSFDQAGWKSETLILLATGTQDVQFYMYNCGSGGASPHLMMRDFTWTPAPNQIYVTMYADGGYLGSAYMLPGATYGDLEVPERAGCEFAGWYRDSSLLERAAESELLPLQANLRVYAKFIQPVSLMDGDGLSFWSDDNTWEFDPSAGWNGGPAVVTDVEYYYNRYRASELELTFEGAGTLAFKWKPGSQDASSSLRYEWEDASGNRSNGSFYFDWDASLGRYKTTDTYVDGWKCESMRLASRGVCDILFSVYNYDESRRPRFSMCDFTWTPAPEVICVSQYDGNAFLGSTNVVPGTTYGDLEVLQERDGYEFLGWYADPELTQLQPMDELLPFVENLTLYGKWGISVSAMDDGTLYFENQGDIPWFVEESSGASGDAAVVAEIPCRNEDSLCAILAAYGASGYGTWSFKWKVDQLDKRYWNSGDFSFFVDGESCNRGSWSYGNWNEQTFRVASEDDHELMWELENWSDRPIRYLISDIVWTPAPAAMTVSFDSDGGADPHPLGYVPGDCYGELPVPTRIGWTFAGWRVGSASGEEVRADDLVPFQESIRLVARWTRSVSYMHDAGLSFRTEGEDKFCQTNVKTPTGGFFAGVTLTKCYQKGGMCVPDSSQYTDKPSSLVTTVTGPGYLTFDWMAKTPGDSSVSCSVLMDGKEVGDFYGWSGEQVGREHVYVPSGKHTLKWEVHGWPQFMEEWNEDLGEYEYTLLAAPSLYIGDIAFEKAGPQKTPAAWVGKLHDYNVFVTGDPAKFKKTYASKIAKNARDYEARVFHALSLLAELAENADFKKFAKTFGYTFDYTHCQFVGTPKLNSKTAAVNTMVDKAIAVAVPAMKSALADLQAIPNSWTGEVMLDAKDWPLDETVALDIADVRFARASLQASIGTLYFLGGYDLTVDWAKVGKEANWEKPLLKVPAIPSVGDSASWSHFAAIEDEVWGFADRIRAVQSGTKVALLVECDHELAAAEWVGYSDLFLRCGNLRYDLYYSSGSGSNCGSPSQGTVSWSVYNSRTDDKVCSISGTLTTSGNRILVVYDCAKVANFSKKSWSVDWGEVSVRKEDGTIRYAEWEDFDGCMACVQKVIMEQTKFFSKVRKASHLTTSKTWITKALNEALAADDAVRARTDDVLHFVEYDPQFAEIQDLARDNTILARDSIASAVEVDFRQLQADFGPEEDIDFTLLPGDGVMRVYLGALFKGKITRAMKPKTRLNGAGDLIANWSALPDPTFGGLLPDMKKENYVSLAAAYGPKDDAILAEPLVPGEKFVLDLSRFAGYSMETKLPKGWVWDSKTGLLTGSTTKKMTLKLKGGGMTESVALDVGPKPKVTVSIDNEEGEGVKSVTGSGAHAANETVKVIAAMKSGYAFGGWYDEAGNLVSAGASYSFKMPRTDLVLTARAVSLREDGFELWSEYCIDDPVELKVGEAVSTEYGRYFGYSTVSPCSISASGLPTGVKLAKVNGGYVLSGKATKKGVYYAKLSGKNNGGFKMSAILKFVVGGAKETFTNTAQIDLERFEWGDPYTGYDYDTFIPVPAKNKIGTVKSIKVTGLPSGYKYKYPVSNDGENCLRIYGVAATPGVYTVTVSATCTNGKVAKSQRKVVVYDSGSVYMPVSLEESSAGRGTVSGGGVKSYGSTVKLVAKSKDTKKYFFADWVGMESAGVDKKWLPATYSFTLKTDYWGKDVYGRFVTKAEDVIAFDAPTYEWRVEYALPACPQCENVNPAWTSCPFGYTSFTKPTITATGLPAGTKLSGSSLVVSTPSKLKPGHYSVKLTAKNVTGNSATATVRVTVPNLTEAVDQGIIKGLDASDEGYECESGTPANFNLLDYCGIEVASGWKLSVSGLPSGWTIDRNFNVSGTALVAGPVTVTFTVAKGTVKKVATATFNMTGLPKWAVGTYVGSAVVPYVMRVNGESVLAYEEGVITMTITTAGKVSGSYAMQGDKTSFSGSGFTWVDNGVLSATVKGKVDGKTKSFKVVLSEEGEASFSGKISSSESIQTELLKRNPWTIPPEEVDNPLPVFGSTLTRSVGWVGFFNGKEQSGTLTLAFGAKGAVKVSWKTSKGSSTASAQIADLVYKGDGLWGGCLVVGVAPNKTKKIAGAYCYVQFALQTDESGVVQDVVVTDELGYDNVWFFGNPPWLW